MELIKTLVLTGYRSFELGVFKEKDPKIEIVKKVIKKTLMDYLEEGLEWVLVSGNLGVETWGAEVVSELKKSYPNLRLGLIFPYKEFGNNWNEQNKQKLQEISHSADFIDATSHETYQNPMQLKNHTRFLLGHSGGCLIVFDEEFPGKSHFFLEDARSFSKQSNYLIHQITMDDLQNAIF